MKGYCLSNGNHPVLQIRPEASASDLTCEMDCLLGKAKALAYILSVLPEGTAADGSVNLAAWCLADTLDMLDAFHFEEQERRAKEARQGQMKAV